MHLFVRMTFLAFGYQHESFPGTGQMLGLIGESSNHRLRNGRDAERIVSKYRHVKAQDLLGDGLVDIVLRVGHRVIVPVVLALAVIGQDGWHAPGGVELSQFRVHNILFSQREEFGLMQVGHVIRSPGLEALGHGNGADRGGNLDEEVGDGLAFFQRLERHSEV